LLGIDQRKLAELSGLSCRRSSAWQRAIVVMGLIIGLSAACFAKAFGIVFLGSPRSREAAEAHEVAWPIRAAMALIALLCVVIGLAAPAVIAALPPVLAAATGLPGGASRRKPRSDRRSVDRRGRVVRCRNRGPLDGGAGGAQAFRRRAVGGSR
jgi:hypothetical protein